MWKILKQNSNNKNTHRHIVKEGRKERGKKREAGKADLKANTIHEIELS